MKDIIRLLKSKYCNYNEHTRSDNVSQMCVNDFHIRPQTLRVIILLHCLARSTPYNQLVTFLVINCIKHFNKLNTLYACMGAQYLSANLDGPSRFGYDFIISSELDFCPGEL